MNEIYLYKNRLMMELLIGKSNYEYYSKESANYMIFLLNNVVIENMVLFFIEEEAFGRYRKIIDEVAEKISFENMEMCSLLIRKLMIISNDDILKEIRKKDFIKVQCELRNVCYNEDDFYLFIKDAVYMDNLLVPFIIYKQNYINSSNEKILKYTNLIESSLNYFFKTNRTDETYYQSFIDFYYDLFNINLLHKANKKIINFPIRY